MRRRAAADPSPSAAAAVSADVGYPHVDYYVAFDCLAEHTPQLAGFVRDAGRPGEAVRTLEERWRWRMLDRRRARLDDGAPPDIAEQLDLAGFDGVALALFWRRALPDERREFDLLGQRIGAKLKCVVLDGEDCWRGVRMRGASVPGDAVRLGPCLARATLGAPIAPKLLFTRQTPAPSMALADVAARMTPAQRALALERLVDAGAVDMRAVARLAAGGVTSSIMIGAALDRWRFAEDGAGWSATLDTGAQHLVLNERDGVFGLDLRVAGSDRVQRMCVGPVVRCGDAAPEHQRKLEALLRFMRELEQVDGLPNANLEAQASTAAVKPAP